jgi:hypothetical protein
MPAVVRPAAARVRDAELRGGHLGHAAKGDNLQLKVGRSDFVYVGADDTIFVPLVSGCPTVIPMKRTARHYAAIGRDGLMEAIRA